MEHASTVDIGARKRRSNGTNEDSIATAVLENHHRQTSRSVGIFVLGDGVGGEARGDVASSLVTTVVRKRLTDELLGPGTDLLERFDIDAYRHDPPTATDEDEPGAVLSGERIRTAIQDGVDTAHQHVQQYAREIDSRPATTIVVGVYFDGRLHYGWVGDSRLYLLNTAHEEIEQLTTDHAVTNELLARGEIDDEEYARVHRDATAITNAIGGSAHGRPTVDVEFGSVAVYSDDVIMLTSDGLIDAYPDVRPLREAYDRADDTESVREEIRETLVTDDELLEIVLDAANLHEAVDRLVSFANDRGGKDNLSIVLARDPSADPSPDSLQPRLDMIDSAALIDQTTVIQAAEDGDVTEDGNATEDGSGGNQREASGTSDPGEGCDLGESDGRSGPNESNEISESSESMQARDSTESNQSGASDHDAGTSADSTANVNVVPAGERGPPTAAITVSGSETVFEIGDGVSIGHDTGVDEERPDIDVVVDDDLVEDNHARVEYDDGAGHWHVRDTSSSGTYVEVDEGEWALLLSSEGADFHREHGFDPGAIVERDLNETYRLEDGMVFSLEDPRNEEPITLRFFTSVDRARNHSPDEDGMEGRRFSRFLV